jgi:hypothetical protein
MKLTGYNLSRKWFDFCFENPEKVAPIHTALYFFAIEHCNRLGWKQKFGLPTEMAKEAIGVKSWHTYIKAFNDIIEFGFFSLIEKSKNQYSSNIIALSNFDEALDEALDEAVTKHASKHLQCTYQSICQSNDSIYKLITNNLKLLTDNKDSFEKFIESLSKGDVSENTLEKRQVNFYNDLTLFVEKYPSEMLRKFYNYWSELNKSKTKMRFEMQKTWELSKRLATWASNNNTFKKSNGNKQSVAERGREIDEIVDAVYDKLGK